MRRKLKIFPEQSLLKYVAGPGGGSNPRSPDHQLDTHPTEPPRQVHLLHVCYYRSADD